MSFEANPRFFAAFMLPPEAEAYAKQVVQSLTTRYRTRTAKAAPHITIQAPFRWPLEDVATLETAIAQVTQAMQPVPIHLCGFGSFPPRVIYIDVERTPELLQVQTQLTQHMQNQPQAIDLKPERRRFSPHVTVASRNMTRSRFKSIWAELKDQPVDFRYVCDRLTLLIYDSRGWHVHREFSLVASP